MRLRCKDRWLGLSDALALSTHSSPSEGCVWTLQADTIAAAVAVSEESSSWEADGYMVLPGVVRMDKVRLALQYLNNHLGSADLAADIDPSGLGTEYSEGGTVKLGKGGHCMCCLSQSAPLLDLVGQHERQQIEGCLPAATQIDGNNFGCQVTLHTVHGPAVTHGLVRWHSGFLCHLLRTWPMANRRWQDL